MQLLIVDGDNLTHRAYHTTPKSVTGTEGFPINAIVGFFSMLSNLWSREHADAVFDAWHTLGEGTYRSTLWPGYQGGRIFEPEIVNQLNMLPTICESFAFGVGKQAGCEADNLMASACCAHVARGGTCLLWTTDKDSYQLVSESATILQPVRGGKEPRRIGPHEVVQEFGVLPAQGPDFKALSGDASDKIPGIKGIGPKSAASLLLRYGTAEAALEAIGRSVDIEMALIFREVATMTCDVPVLLPEAGPDWVRGARGPRLRGAGNVGGGGGGVGG